jgi:hypothetical protein
MAVKDTIEAPVAKIARRGYRDRRRVEDARRRALY